MAMVLSDLWSRSNRSSLQSTLSHLKKYKHLIKWKANESILEIGFANGSNSALSLQPLLPNDYKEFIASDISENMVNDAKKNCKLPNSKVVQMDIASSTIPSEYQNRFHHIFGFLVLHRVKNPRQAFKNIRYMLKPGGTTFLTFFERTPIDDIMDRLRNHPKWFKYRQEEMISPYFYCKNPGENYKKDLEAAKFTDYILELEKDSYTFASEEESNNLIISVNSVAARIPKEEYTEYIKDCVEEKERANCFEISYNNNNEKIITLNSTIYVLLANKV